MASPWGALLGLSALRRRSHVGREKEDEEEEREGEGLRASHAWIGLPPARGG